MEIPVGGRPATTEIGTASFRQGACAMRGKGGVGAVLAGHLAVSESSVPGPPKGSAAEAVGAFSRRGGEGTAQNLSRA